MGETGKQTKYKIERVESVPLFVRVYPILPRPLMRGRITFYKGIVENGESNNGFCIKIKEKDKNTYDGICMRSSEYSGGEYRPKPAITYDEATGIITDGNGNAQREQFRSASGGWFLYLPCRGAHTIIIAEVSGRIAARVKIDSNGNGCLITNPLSTGAYILCIQKSNEVVAKK